MTTKNNPNTTAVSRELILTRVFDAPREMVFKAWTDAKHMAQWWGPKDFTNPVCELDARPGGALRITMRGPDGALFPSNGVFREIVEPERLVFIATGFEDESGNPKLEVLNTVTFEAVGGKTKLTLHAVVTRMTLDLSAGVSGMNQGWNESLDRLEAVVSGQLKANGG